MKSTKINGITQTTNQRKIEHFHTTSRNTIWSIESILLMNDTGSWLYSFIACQKQDNLKTLVLTLKGVKESACWCRVLRTMSGWMYCSGFIHNLLFLRRWKKIIFGLNTRWLLRPRHLLRSKFIKFQRIWSWSQRLVAAHKTSQARGCKD